MKFFLIVVVFAFILFLFGCINMPVCGNDICEDGETEFSCRVDCSLVSKSCMEMGGFICGINKSCPTESIESYNPSDETICCSAKCTKELIYPGSPVETNECEVDSDCDDGDDSTINACSGSPKKCVSELKSCLELGGQVCDVNSFCEGEVVVSVDEPGCCVGGCKEMPLCDVLSCAENENCVADRCVLKTCQEQGGEPCILPKECTSELISSSNVSICCLQGDCKRVQEFSCSRDQHCKLGCATGDPDCMCEEQGGEIVYFTRCVSQEDIEAFGIRSPQNCCLDPLISTTCFDTDAGINFDAKGSCYSSGITKSGKIVELSSGEDQCGFQGGVNDKYCGQQNQNIENSEITINECLSTSKYCEFCAEGVCFDGKFTEERLVLKEGEFLENLVGNGMYLGQNLSVKLDAVNPIYDGSVYEGEFFLLDQNGIRLDSAKIANSDKYLTTAFRDDYSILSLKAIIYIHKVRVDSETGVGEADLSVSYGE